MAEQERYPPACTLPEDCPYDGQQPLTPWGLGADALKLMGRSVPKRQNPVLKEWTTQQSTTHGGSTRADPRAASFTRKEFYDLMAVDRSTTQAGRYNSNLLNGLLTYILLIFSGVPLRVYTRSNAYQAAALAIMALLIGLVAGSTLFDHQTHPGLWDGDDSQLSGHQHVAALMRQPINPYWITANDLKDTFSSLTNFVLGLYVSLVISKIYYAQRNMLGTVFGRVLGFTMRLTASAKLRQTSGGDRTGAAVTEMQLMRAKRRLVRWANACFRLLWLEECGYDAQIHDSIRVMDGLYGPLLTTKEWGRISDRLSRVTHIIQWMNTTVVDLCDAGCLNPMDASELTNLLDEMRGSNNYGLSSMPYPYVLAIAMMTKFFLLSHALANAFPIGLHLAADRFYRANPHLAEEASPNSLTAVNIFFILMKVMIVSFLYQALLDLYVLLKKPNQGILSGHMPVPTFLQFSESVTFAMLTATPTVPRPLLQDDSGDEDVAENDKA